MKTTINRIKLTQGWSGMINVVPMAAAADVVYAYPCAQINHTSVRPLSGLVNQHSSNGQENDGVVKLGVIFSPQVLVTLVLSVPIGTVRLYQQQWKWNWWLS